MTGSRGVAGLYWSAMSDETRRYEEILARPWDDRPRVAYAEALEKRGDPRGELVRVQLELYWDLAGHRLGPKYLANSRRETELLKAHGDEWAREVRPLVDDLTFERGFIDWVTCDARAYLERAGEIAARAPLLHLQVTGAKAHTETFFASPALARLRSLLLPGEKIGDAGLEHLAASPHLGEIRYLDLFGNEITRRGLEALCASPNLPKLRFVRWTSNRVSDPSDRPAAVDNGQILEWEADPIQAELEEKYGHKEWMHHQTLQERFYPPHHWEFITAQ
jgi:uncharacterized protein (TIGR02996 family)